MGSCASPTVSPKSTLLLGRRPLDHGTMIHGEMDRRAASQRWQGGRMSRAAGTVDGGEDLPLRCEALRFRRCESSEAA